jgi:acylphosphatase
MVDRVHICVEGMVQGVGYRYSAQHRAVALGLNGWVRNLPDGRVEMELEGPKPELEQMAEWCAVGPRTARITNVDAKWEHGEPKYHTFQIKGW